jgi:hypothetical protein
MSMDAYENGNKCIHDKNSFYHPFDDRIVNTESELTGRGRKLSKCQQSKYNPSCPDSDQCISTYSKSVPIVYSQAVCPIVKNNLKDQKCSR